MNVFLFATVLVSTSPVTSKPNLVLQHPILTSDYHSFLKNIYKSHGNLYRNSNNNIKNNSNLGVCHGEDSSYNDYENMYK